MRDLIIFLVQYPSLLDTFIYVSYFHLLHRWTCEFCEQASCDRDGWPASSRQDLHIQKAVPIPQLDRHQHKGLQPGRVQATRHHGLPVPRVLPSWQHKGYGDTYTVCEGRLERRLSVVGERRWRGSRFRRHQLHGRETSTHTWYRCTQDGLQTFLRWVGVQWSWDRRTEHYGSMCLSRTIAMLYWTMLYSTYEN